MSYCRWSSDDFQCDVYVYEHYRNYWVTHVAARRIVYKEELPPIIPHDTPYFVDRWTERYMAVNKMWDQADRVDIGLPHDGDTFEHDSPGECAENLERLRDMGYVVPQYAIDALKEEQEELDTSSPQEAGKG